MYLPSHFHEERAEELAALIGAHPLGLLVTLDGARAEVDHVPMLLEPGTPARLIGHVARANPVATRVAAGTEVLVVFRGADHYVTPSWYESKRTDRKVVPTWNYAVAHVRGRIRWIDAPDALHRIVAQLTTAHEAARPAPWAVSDAPADYLAKMLGAIVGFEIAIESTTGKFKASQNRSAADRSGVAHGLAADGVAPAAIREIAREPRR